MVNLSMPIRLLFALFAACLLVSLPCSPAISAEDALDRQALHILNRLAFGPTLEDLQHVEAIGVDRYIEEQLNPLAISEPPELIERLAALDTLQLDPARLFEIYGPRRLPGGMRPSAEELKTRRERARIIVQQAAEARILRATMSHRQLQEVMVDFWYNHFNVFAGKGLDQPPFEPVSNDVTPALWFKQPGNNNGSDDDLFAPQGVALIRVSSTKRSVAASMARPFRPRGAST